MVTRWLLHHVQSLAPRMPMYGLVDFDPHGIRIFRTYKYGSHSLRHEDNTTVPRLIWLGIRSSDLTSASSSAATPWSALDDALPLTDADRKTAIFLLKEISLSQNGGCDDESLLKQRREVQVMLMLNIKAEIQAADDYGDLASWLDDRLGRAQQGESD